MTELAWRMLQPYVFEVADLAASLLRSFAWLESLSRSWRETSAVADEQVAMAPDHDAVLLKEVLDNLRADQGTLFERVEAFLAAWARLSLLFFPTGGNGEAGKFKRIRGASLRKRFAVSGESIFRDRDLRDAWMHFDERLDAEIRLGRFGDRQRFVEAARADPYAENTVRLLEVDTLVIHYRTRVGEPKATDLRALSKSVEGLLGHLGQAGCT